MLTTLADQCYGLATNSAGVGFGMSPEQKKTRFMINGACIAEELKRKCDGSHKHQQLVGGRAAKAAIYPEGLCRAICKGLMGEMKKSRDQVKRICVLKATDTVKGECRHEDEWSREQNARDDISGQALDEKEVERARQKELGYKARMEEDSLG